MNDNGQLHLFWNVQGVLKPAHHGSNGNNGGNGNGGDPPDFPNFDDDMPLGEARAIIRARIDEGIRCPCCDRFVKRYHRKIYGSQARELIHLYWLSRQKGRQFYHRTVVTHETGNNDLVFLRHWRLIDLRPNDDLSKKDSGFYRITDFGTQFVELKARVPKYCVIYNDELQGFTGDQVSIVDALGKKFSYDELMAA